ncbi:amidohydrolase family protein [Salinisphaera sp.]|uniref:amidohydrolase family protein n=1 Tax=Salinisphaera sp. TaxID=1914330 RepID=UPI002D764FC5|nr:amidohydrolase family protein [Salinisphaera sp.]HET7315502.1 amidohydrolase family protein [Salinisphaera sp.]
MIIDAHQHFWRYDPARLDWIATGMEELMHDWLPVDFAAARAETGIDRTIAVQATGDEAETAFLMEQAAAEDWIAGVVGWVDLTAPNVDERIACWQQTGPLVGLRHQIEGDPARLNDPAFDTGVAAVQRRGLVYEVLVNHRQLIDAVAFCARHDAHALVIDHLAKPAITGDEAAFSSWRESMAALAAMPHVAVKISGLATEAQPAPGDAPDIDGIHRHLDAALELFGADRLIFGSDWPVSRLAIDYGDWFALIDAWAGAQGTDCRAKLFGANAASIYSLDL